MCCYQQNEAAGISKKMKGRNDRVFCAPLTCPLATSDAKKCEATLARSVHSNGNLPCSEVRCFAEKSGQTRN